MDDILIGNPQETHGVSEADIGWLAGIIDGEGSISLAMGYIKNGRLNNMSPRIEIGNTDKELVEKFVKIVKSLGCGIYMTLKKESLQSKLVKAKEGKNFKPIYYAKAVGFLRTKKILDIVLPYLTGLKRIRGELIIKFINDRLRKNRDVKGGRHAPLDQQDLLNAIEIAKTMKTKFTPVLEGLLRDYTRAQQKVA